jgi:hypothetical protein
VILQKSQFSHRILRIIFDHIIVIRSTRLISFFRLSSIRFVGQRSRTHDTAPPAAVGNGARVGRRQTPKRVAKAFQDGVSASQKPSWHYRSIISRHHTILLSQYQLHIRSVHHHISFTKSSRRHFHRVARQLSCHILLGNCSISQGGHSAWGPQPYLLQIPDTSLDRDGNQPSSPLCFPYLTSFGFNWRIPQFEHSATILLSLLGKDWKGFFLDTWCMGRTRIFL